MRRNGWGWADEHSISHGEEVIASSRAREIFENYIQQKMEIQHLTQQYNYLIAENNNLHTHMKGRRNKSDHEKRQLEQQLKKLQRHIEGGGPAAKNWNSSREATEAENAMLRGRCHELMEELTALGASHQNNSPHGSQNERERNVSPSRTQTSDANLGHDMSSLQNTIAAAESELAGTREQLRTVCGDVLNSRSMNRALGTQLYDLKQKLQRSEESQHANTAHYTSLLDEINAEMSRNRMKSDMEVAKAQNGSMRDLAILGTKTDSLLSQMSRDLQGARNEIASLKSRRQILTPSKVVHNDQEENERKQFNNVNYRDQSRVSGYSRSPTPKAHDESVLINGRQSLPSGRSVSRRTYL